jgi:hypothetical protein
LGAGFSIFVWLDISWNKTDKVLWGKTPGFLEGEHLDFVQFAFSSLLFLPCVLLYIMCLSIHCLFNLPYLPPLHPHRSWWRGSQWRWLCWVCSQQAQYHAMWLSCQCYYDWAWASLQKQGCMASRMIRPRQNRKGKFLGPAHTWQWEYKFETWTWQSQIMRFPSYFYSGNLICHREKFCQYRSHQLQRMKCDRTEMLCTSERQITDEVTSLLAVFVHNCFFISHL